MMFVSLNVRVIRLLCGNGECSGQLGQARKDKREWGKNLSFPARLSCQFRQQAKGVLMERYFEPGPGSLFEKEEEIK